MSRRLREPWTSVATIGAIGLWGVVTIEVVRQIALDPRPRPIWSLIAPAIPQKAGAPANADAPTLNSDAPAREAGVSVHAARSDLARGTNPTGTGD